MLKRKHIRRRLERAAATFDKTDFVHANTREGLFARLAPLLLTAETVVNLGAATSAANKDLEKHFKPARVIAVEIAHAMLMKAREQRSWLSKTRFVQANVDTLPFATGSIDVIFSNLLLPWIDDTEPLFFEVARVLRKGGVFAFATLGPDSLQEIGRAWAAIDGSTNAYRFPDMHNIGDALVKAGLRDPVLDVDHLSVSYSDSGHLLSDLAALGAAPAAGKRRHFAMCAVLDDSAIDNKIVVNLELVFGHCWGGGPRMDASNYRIDASRIPIRSR